MITFGTGYVGKVDRVPGAGYVLTKVFQIVNVPFIPLGGYLVREGSEDESIVMMRSFEGTPRPICWRSFAWAWLRVLLFVGALASLLGFVPAWLGLRGPAFSSGLVLGIVLLVVWWRTRRGLLASPARAREIEAELAAAAMSMPTATARFPR